MGSSNLCEKQVKADLIDRLSGLPDEILGKILSYLPTKDVVATSILSTRWRLLYPAFLVTFSQLDFDDSHGFGRSRGGNHSYVSINNFVDKLLNVMTLHAVEKVVFRCNEVYCDAKIVSWIRSALRLRVKHLRLMCRVSLTVPLFASLHGCTTLVELELGFSIGRLLLPQEFGLSNLKRLLLQGTTLSDDFHKLIAGCPVLDELSIMDCHCYADRQFSLLVIQHPSITKLTIKGWNKTSGFQTCTIVIDAPNLETLVHKGLFDYNFICRNIDSLHSVFIDFNCRQSWPGFLAQAKRLFQLLKPCSRIRNLFLLGNSVMALCGLRDDMLPIFQNLTCLVLGRMGAGGWRILARFLKSTPNLTNLTFEEGLEFSGSYTHFKYLLPTAPICLKLRIKKIEIWKFSRTPDHFKLIEYFLNNGGVLQDFVVRCLPFEKISELEILSRLPKNSVKFSIQMQDSNRCPKP